MFSTRERYVTSAKEVIGISGLLNMVRVKMEEEENNHPRVLI